MKLQGKKTGAFAGFIGWIEPEHAPIDPKTGIRLLTVQYKDAGINCYKDYETIAAFSADWEDYTPDPDPSYLIVKIQKLENSVKELDERLKTVEEIVELRSRKQGADHRQGQTFGLEIPPREKFKRMKQDLRDWIEKNKVDKIRACYHTEPDGRRGVMFVDKTHPGDNRLLIIGWPTIGLIDCATYTPDELLITGKAGKE